MMTKKKLLQLIAVECERAFRRGYQHGATFGKGHETEIAEWRFQRKLTNCLQPPGSGGHKCSAEERFLMELQHSELYKYLVLEPKK
jgi:hypothetical protein